MTLINLRLQRIIMQKLTVYNPPRVCFKSNHCRTNNYKTGTDICADFKSTAECARAHVMFRQYSAKRAGERARTGAIF